MPFHCRLSRAAFRRSGRPLLLFALAGIPVFSSSLFGQSLPPEAVPATPPPAATSPATVPGLTKENGRFTLNFVDTPVDLILDELSATAGFVVVKQIKPEGRITLVTRQPVGGEEIVSLLNTVLQSAGCAAIQQGRTLKIVPRDQARHLSIPVRSGSDPARIDPTDELITQVIPLRYAVATELRQDLQPLVNPDADFTANASSNALVITDTAANVRRIVQIINALDTSLADAVEVKVFQLEYANAGNAARLINDVFGNLEVAGQGQQLPEGAPPWARMREAQQQQQRSQQGRARTNKVTAAADDRTNSIVVTGPVDTLGVVAQVVKELDANPVADETVFVYRLRNAQAINLEGVVNSLFGSTGGSARQNQQGQTTLPRSNQSGNNRTIGSSARGGTGSRTSGTATRTGSATTRFGQSQGGQQARVSAAAAQTASDLAGRVSIIADPDSNSLLVRTSPTNYDRVKTVLAELDKPVAQVLIKVLIAEVTHDDSRDLGVEFSILNLRPSGQGQQGGTSFNIPVTGANATGLVVQILESDVTATIRALETQGKLDVLSRPYILASDNQLASITVGQEVPFITNSRITDNGQTINTIEYGDVGILLDVVPHINPDGLVILDVAPEISTLTGTSVPISELVSAPVIAKRSAQSRVGVRTGQTIVIGGLMEDRKTQTVNKVPLLGDIPLLGEAFKRTQDSKAKTELLIFLTPHVAAAPEELGQITDQEMQGTKLVPGAVAPGLFDQHREGLQRGSLPAESQPADPATQPAEPIPSSQP